VSNAKPVFRYKGRLKFKLSDGLFALKTLNIPAKSGIIAYYFDLSEHIRRARLTFHRVHGKIP